MVCCAEQGNGDTFSTTSISNDESKINHVESLKDSDVMPSDCGQDENQWKRIFGGDITEVYEFSWLALLEYHEQRKFLS